MQFYSRSKILIMWNAFWLVQLTIFIFRFIVMTTSGGIMDHEEARRKHLGGKILGFFFWECNLCTNKGAESILCLFFMSHHIITNQRLLIHIAPQKIPWNIVLFKSCTFVTMRMVSFNIARPIEKQLHYITLILV